MELEELITYNGGVEELEWDEDLLQHINERGFYAKHDVTIAEILEVHRSAPKYFPNVSTGSAPMVMVGPTATNRFLCVPIEPTGKFGIWRPLTAFEANTHHRQRYGGDQL
jgi:hypothetical protein